VAETIQDIGSGRKWHWYNIEDDLKRQGGLDKITIDPLSFMKHGCIGSYDGNSFCVSWVRNLILMVTMQQFSQRLISAFAQIVEYDPFCSYEQDDGNLITVEWVKGVANMRFEKLQQDRAITNLVRLSGKGGALDETA